ncbi:hypothetical protein D3C85_1142760 [compost metagenome]
MPIIGSTTLTAPKFRLRMLSGKVKSIWNRPTSSLIFLYRISTTRPARPPILGLPRVRRKPYRLGSLKTICTSTAHTPAVCSTPKCAAISQLLSGW